MVIHDAHLTSSSGGTEILNLPGSLPTFNLLSLASRLDARRPRLFPIDIAAVLGPIVKSAELRVTLPEGWHARLPAAIAETSEFGSYHASYTQTGRELRIVREISGRQGTAPADHVNALIAWLRAVSKDDVRYIVLEHGH